MPTLKSLAVFSIFATTILFGCGGSGGTSATLEPGSFSVTQIPNVVFVTASQSGAIVMQAADQTYTLRNARGQQIPLQIPANEGLSFRMSPNGRYMVVIRVDPSNANLSINELYRDGVIQTTPALPSNSSPIQSVDNEGFVFGVTPTEIFRTNGNETQFCTRPIIGLAGGTYDKRSQTPTVFPFDNNFNSSIWYRFIAGGAAQPLRDYNLQNYYNIQGVLANGTEFGTYTEQPTTTGYFGNPGSARQMFGISGVSQVYGVLDDGTAVYQPTGSPVPTAELNGVKVNIPDLADEDISSYEIMAVTGSTIVLRNDDGNGTFGLILLSGS